MDSNLITLVCGCDDNYAPHAAVMLRSAEDKLSSNSRLVVHVLHDEGLSSESFDAIKASVDRAEVYSLPIPASFMQGMPVEQFHRACWHRIFIPDLLPDTQRALYLDTDMVVVDDLSLLWETDLGDFPFGAVTNPLYPFMPFKNIENLGIQDPSDYLNTGCLLLDLEKLRRLGFSKMITAYAKQNPDNRWPEQDAISALFLGRWKKLAPRWNAQNTLFEVPAKQLPFSKQQSSQARKHPAIVHFIGPHKPWTYIAKHPYKERYRHYRAQTAWANWQYPDRTLFNMLIRHLPLEIQLKFERLKARLFS